MTSNPTWSPWWSPLSPLQHGALGNFKILGARVITLCGVVAVVFLLVTVLWLFTWLFTWMSELGGLALLPLLAGVFVSVLVVRSMRLATAAQARVRRVRTRRDLSIQFEKEVVKLREVLGSRLASPRMVECMKVQLDVQRQDNSVTVIKQEYVSALFRELLRNRKDQLLHASDIATHGVSGVDSALWESLISLETATLQGVLEQYLALDLERRADDLYRREVKALAESLALFNRRIQSAGTSPGSASVATSTAPRDDP